MDEIEYRMGLENFCGKNLNSNVAVLTLDPDVAQTIVSHINDTHGIDCNYLNTDNEDWIKTSFHTHSFNIVDVTLLEEAPKLALEEIQKTYPSAQDLNFVGERSCSLYEGEFLRSFKKASSASEGSIRLRDTIVIEFSPDNIERALKDIDEAVNTVQSPLFSFVCEGDTTTAYHAW